MGNSRWEDPKMGGLMDNWIVGGGDHARTGISNLKFDI
jgi:hypothetical protein